jgi:hypothetical protein
MPRPSSGNDLPITRHRDLFLGQVPAEILAAALRAILQSYRDASSACYEVMRPAQAKEASGPFRRNKIDSEFLGIGDRFKRQLKAETNPYNQRHTGSYVELTCGLIKMTASCVLTPSDLPREADYRETLATNPQMVLGDFLPEQPVGEFLYAILLHGVDDSVKQRAGCRFAQIRFPLPGFKGYTEDRIDLFATFPAIVAEYSEVQTPSDDLTKLPLRLIPKTGEA